MKKGENCIKKNDSREENERESEELRRETDKNKEEELTGVRNWDKIKKKRRE